MRRILSSSVLATGLAIALLVTGSAPASAVKASVGSSGSCVLYGSKEAYTATATNSTCTSVTAALYYRDSSGTLRWTTAGGFYTKKATATSGTSMVTSRYVKAKLGSGYSAWYSF